MGPGLAAVAAARRLRWRKRDRPLVDSVRAGDDAAYEHIFRAHYVDLCRFAYQYLGSPTLAEAVVQDLLAEVWENRASLAVSTSIRAYLFGATRERTLALLTQTTALNLHLAPPEMGSVGRGSTRATAIE